jgi:uncharacterized membrane protein
MNHLKAIHIIYVFGTALFAGLLYTFEQGVIPMQMQLTATEYVKVQQLLILNLDKGLTGVIAVATLSMLLPIYPLIRQWKHRSTAYWRWNCLGWVLFCFGVSIFTIVLNVPINEIIKAMDPNNPAADWMSLRDQWNRLNMIRTPINYLSLIAYLIAGFQPFPADK